MKYKVVINGTIMEAGVSATKALNCICGAMSGRLPHETFDVKVYYLSTKNGEESYRLENGFIVRGTT